MVKIKNYYKNIHYINAENQNSNNYDNIDDYISNHEKNDDYIENILDFKLLWDNKCSKYNIQSQPSILPKVSRIIVIGDIHGDLKMTYETLQTANLIDDSKNWCGGDTVVVQVGDQIDRCRYTNSIPCKSKHATIDDEGNDYHILKYFTELHYQAQKVGGAVYSLLGNHELMNVQQNLNYVSYKGFEEFNNYIKPDNTIIEDGEEARLWAFKKGNPISEFLACTRQVALIIGSNLFVHAGILPHIAKKYNVSNINKIMTLYLLDKINTDDTENKENFDYSDIFNPSEYSPLWNRMFGNIGLEKYNDNIDVDTDTICNSLINPLEKIYNVGKIYVGHTPLMDKGISSLCDNKIWLTDYGLSSAFNKFDGNSRSKIRNAHVLEIIDDGREFNILKKKA